MVSCPYRGPLRSIAGEPSLLHLHAGLVMTIFELFGPILSLSEKPVVFGLLKLELVDVNGVIDWKFQK